MRDSPEATNPERSAADAVNLLPSCLQAALAGALGGAVAALLLQALDGLQAWVWGPAASQGLPVQRPLLWCLAVPGAIGLLLSLLRLQRPGAGLPELGATLAGLRHRELAGASGPLRPVLGGVLALIGGGSLGPEALVSHVVVLLSRAIWRGRDRQLAAAALAGSLGFFGTPLVGPLALAGRRAQLLWRWLPGTLAGVTGFLSFHGLRGLAGGLQGVPYTLPLPQQTPQAVLAALLGAALGCGCGLALLGWRRWLQRLMGLPLLELPLPLLGLRPAGLAPLVTGLLLGASLWLLPLAPFSGERQLQPLLLGHWDLPPALLLLSGAVKLLLVGLCLETGWRGGLIFPVILASSAIGAGLHALLPAFAAAGSWVGSVVGGSLGIVMPSPLLALVLGLTLLRGHGAAALLIGLLVAQVIRRQRSRREAGEPG